MKRYIIILFSLLAFHAAYAQTAGQKDTLAAHPWSTSKTYNTSTGKILTAGKAELERRPIGDLRNRLVGMLPGVDITEYGGGVYQAATTDYSSYLAGGSSNKFHVNGFNNLHIFVDDMPIPFNQILLDPNQLESVTVLTDVVDKSKLGPLASYGAILLKTSRGEYNTPLKINVSVESGLNFAQNVFPWADGADYAALNNQMRESEGLDPLYSDEAIAAFGKHDENDILYPAVNYREKMLRSAFSTTNVGFSASAGSANIKYSFGLNYLNYGDMFKADETDYNKVNLTGSVTTRIGRYIEATAGFMGMLGYRRTPNINWYDYRSVPEVAYPLVLGNVTMSEDTDSDLANMVGQPIYGVSHDFTENYYARLIEGGRQMTRTRSGMFNANVNIDFGWLLKGLKSRTSILTSSYILTKIGKSNDYIAYYWDAENGAKQISNHKGEKQTSRSLGTGLTNNMLIFHERLYYDWERNGHTVNTGLSYYQSNSSQSGDTYYQRMQFAEGDVSWSYKGRYNVEASAQFDGSHRFKGKARWGFFPTVGASWIVSNESFLKGNPVLTRLKLYAQAGDIAQTDVFGTPYLYQGLYSNAASTNIEYGPSVYAGTQWFGTQNMTSTKTVLSRYPNSSLTWQRLSQQSVGLDVGLLGCITLSADMFFWKRYGNIADVISNTPGVFGITATTYDNYESVRTAGFNVSLGFNKAWKDWSVNAWASMSWDNQWYDNLVSDDYLYDYQKLTGSTTYAIRGLRCIGRYRSQKEIDNLPSYVDKETLKVGDLKYWDRNKDGVIDQNDEMIIGYSDPLSFIVNVEAKWKNLSLQIVGTGHAGEDFSLAYSSYFTGAQGMDNQSQFVIDNVGKMIPRVEYYGVPNNEVLSSYWIRKANWFKIKAVDIGYDIPFKEGNRLGISSVRLDLRGGNLITFSGFKYMDLEDTRAGLTRYPLFRTLTFGAKVIF